MSGLITPADVYRIINEGLAENQILPGVALTVEEVENLVGSIRVDLPIPTVDFASVLEALRYHKNRYALATVFVSQATSYLLQNNNR